MRHLTLTGILTCTLLLVTSAHTAQPLPADPPPDITLTLENVASTAWRVTGIDGPRDGDAITEVGVDNPPIRLRVGQRYHFANLGTRAVHPLAIRGVDGTPVLSQRPADRPFEIDPEVAFVTDDDGITFTLTASLAAVVETYYCLAHPAPLMEGALEVVDE